VVDLAVTAMDQGWCMQAYTCQKRLRCDGQSAVDHAVHALQSSKHSCNVAMQCTGFKGMMTGAWYDDISSSSIGTMTHSACPGLPLSPVACCCSHRVSCPQHILVDCCHGSKHEHELYWHPQQDHEGMAALRGPLSPDGSGHQHAAVPQQAICLERGAPAHRPTATAACHWRRQWPW